MSLFYLPITVKCKMHSQASGLCRCSTSCLKIPGGGKECWLFLLPGSLANGFVRMLSAVISFSTLSCHSRPVSFPKEQSRPFTITPQLLQSQLGIRTMNSDGPLGSPDFLFYIALHLPICCFYQTLTKNLALSM